MVVQNIKNCYNTRPLYAATIVFFAFFLLSSIFFVFFSQGDPHWGDQYFHFKYAYLLRTEGIDVVKNFDWIYLSWHADSSRYAVNLFQIALIPFTFFSDHLFGMKVADIFYMSVAVTLFYYVLRKMHVKYPLFFTLMLFLYTYFPLRLLLSRAFILITVLLFVEMWLAVEKKYRWLFGTPLFHILWHQSTYFMPIGVIGIVEMSRYLVMKKIDVKNCIAVLCGTIVGMAFFPGFPASLIHWMKSLVAIQFNAHASPHTQENMWGGSELAVRDFMEDFASMDMYFVFFILSTCAVAYMYTTFKKQKQEISTDIQKRLVQIFSVFIFALVVVWMSFTVSGRTFDFFVPAVVLLSALVFTHLYDRVHIADAFFITFMKWAMIIIVGFSLLNTYTAMHAHVNAFDYTPSYRVSEWIAHHADAKERVFLRNWTTFTLLFAGNHKNVYSMGIEPQTLKVYDREIYWKYYNIFWYNYWCEEQKDCREKFEKEKAYLEDKPRLRKAREKENSENIIRFIRDELDTKYIVSDKEAFTNTLLFSEELIEDHFYVKTQKELEGSFMEYTVFKLR